MVWVQKGELASEREEVTTESGGVGDACDR